MVDVGFEGETMFGVPEMLSRAMLPVLAIEIDFW